MDILNGSREIIAVVDHCYYTEDQVLDESKPDRIGEELWLSYNSVPLSQFPAARIRVKYLQSHAYSNQ